MLREGAKILQVLTGDHFALFSSSLLRCRGVAKSIVSTICPDMTMKPDGRSAASMRANMELMAPRPW